MRVPNWICNRLGCWPWSVCWCDALTRMGTDNRCYFRGCGWWIIRVSLQQVLQKTNLMILRNSERFLQFQTSCAYSSRSAAEYVKITQQAANITTYSVKNKIIKMYGYLQGGLALFQVYADCSSLIRERHYFEMFFFCDPAAICAIVNISSQKYKSFSVHLLSYSIILFLHCAMFTR